MKYLFNKRVRYFTSIISCFLLIAQINVNNLNDYFANNETYASERVAKVETGKFHSGVLTNEGRLFMWGANGAGQIGNNSSSNQFIPIDLTLFNQTFNNLGNDKIVDFSLGADHSGAVTSSGRVFMWGSNGDGRLGNNIFIGTSTPVEITNRFPTDDPVIQLSLGGQHSAALTRDGKLFMWGKGGYGQLGRNNTGSTSTPTQINNINGSLLSSLKTTEKIIKVDLGSEHSAVLTNLGNVYIWGRGSVGQIGNGTFNDNNLLPFLVSTRLVGLSSNERVTGISLGREHSMVVTSFGKLFAWGGGSGGRLGTGTETNESTPRNITFNGAVINAYFASDSIASIDAGLLHSIAITKKGRLFSWGDGGNGRLGSGNLNNQLLPIEITNTGNDLTQIPLGNIHSISAGFQHSVIATKTHQILTFGISNFGQTGNGGTSDLLTATNITNNGALKNLNDKNIAIQLMNVIENLPTNPKISDKLLIDNAYETYTRLNQTQKGLVQNIIKLINIRTILYNLINQYQDVIILINQLPMPDNFDINHEPKLIEARTSFDSLTLEQKNYITNLSKLIELENRLSTIKLIIANVETLINALP
jgi:alpha-tubulin suppressor-like RCC1 family protein